MSTDLITNGNQLQFTHSYRIIPYMLPIDPSQEKRMSIIIVGQDDFLLEKILNYLSLAMPGKKIEGSLLEILTKFRSQNKQNSYTIINLSDKFSLSSHSSIDGCPTTET